MTEKHEHDAGCRGENHEAIGAQGAAADLRRLREVVTAMAEDARPVAPRGATADRTTETLLREALADLCHIRERVSDDVEAFAIGRHPETGEWRVWHEDYADEGSEALVPKGATAGLGDRVRALLAHEDLTVEVPLDDDGEERDRICVVCGCLDPHDPTCPLGQIAALVASPPPTADLGDVERALDRYAFTAYADEHRHVFHYQNNRDGVMAAVRALVSVWAPEGEAVKRVVRMAQALMARSDWWRAQGALPGEYDDLDDALAALAAERKTR